MKRIGVLRFPGTNCDRDVFNWVQARGYQAQYLWHLDRFDSKVADGGFEALILPGGFSYGDYLRSGALAAISPAMSSVREYANQGGRVLGICNGFQILCEAQLLPGALVKNEGRRFIDSWVELQVSGSKSCFAKEKPKGSRLRLPVAHGDGRYYASEAQLSELFQKDQVWLQYLEAPNGSLRNIAGVVNQEGNVAGLMPHPERAIQSWMGGMDGWDFI